jgi:tetratricopeptide (TPR) repeat protein
VINCLKLLLLLLLVKPAPGFGQQPPASKLDALLASAQNAQAQHDYGTAAKAYKQAVTIRPDIPELWANLGVMQHEAGDFSGAFVSLSQANRLNPALYVPNLFFGIDYVRAGKAKQAIPFLLKAERINKTDPQPPMTLGRAYLSLHNLPAATKELTQAVKLNPSLSSAWFSLGIAYLDRVEEEGRKVATEDQSSPYAQALFAESLERQSRYKEASKIYSSLIASNPQPPCMHAELGLSLLKQHDLAAAGREFTLQRQSDPGCGLAILGQAQLAIETGSNAEAIRLLQELWSRDHGFVLSNSAVISDSLSGSNSAVFLGALAEERNTIPAGLYSLLSVALTESPQLSNESPTETDPVLPLAAQPVSASSSAAERDYAAGHFTQCASRIKPGPPAKTSYQLELLATCSFFAGDYAASSDAANALSLLRPHSMEALYWAIKADERLAIRSLSRYQKLEPDSARSHILLGDIYRQRERYDDATSEYKKALGLAPSDPAASFGLASAYLANNIFDKAIETAQTALQHNSEDPEYNLLMAEALVANNDLAKAEPFLKKALNAKPQMLPHVHALLGRVYAGSGRTADAIAQLKLGASSDEDGALHYQLAHLYRQNGDTRSASEALEQMKVIKEGRRQRGFRAAEDPDLSISPPGPQ